MRLNKYSYSSLKKMWEENYIQFIRRNLHQDLTWDSISWNPHISYETIKNNPDLPCNYDGMSYNPNITIDIVKNNPDKPWNFDNLSYNDSITWQDIKNNPHYEWNYSEVARRMDWETIKNNPILWNKYILSENRFIKINRKAVIVFKY